MWHTMLIGKLYVAETSQAHRILIRGGGAVGRNMADEEEEESLSRDAMWSN